MRVANSKFRVLPQPPSRVVAQASNHTILAKAGPGISKFLGTMPFVIPPVQPGDPDTCGFYSVPRGLQVTALIDLEKIGYRQNPSEPRAQSYGRASRLWHDTAVGFLREYTSRLSGAARRFFSDGIAAVPCLHIVPSYDDQLTTKGIGGLLLNNLGAGIEDLESGRDTAAEIYTPQVLHRYQIIPPRVWAALDNKLLNFFQSHFGLADLGLRARKFQALDHWVRTLHTHVPLRHLAEKFFTGTPTVYEINDLWLNQAPAINKIVGEVSADFERQGCQPLNLDRRAQAAVLGNHGDFQVVFSLGLGFFGIDSETGNILTQSTVDYATQYLGEYDQRN